MKTIFLIRHAKSSWDQPLLKDIDRPLNKRGFRDAPFMANMLSHKIKAPDQLISSPAKRAFTTATYFAEAFKIKPADIQREKGIYEAYTQELLYLVQHLDSSLDTVCLFGHNPGFTSLANQFATDFIDNVPTCGIVEIAGDIDDWSEFQKKKVAVKAFYFPKQFY